MSGRPGGKLLVAAIGASLVALGVALACAWQLLEREELLLGDPDVVELERTVDGLEARLAELSARLAAFESEPTPVDVEAELAGVVREEMPADERRESDGGADPGSEDNAPVRSKFRRLARAATDDERLQVARELVASQNGLEQAAGARVLAELSPAEAFQVVDGWLAEVRAGSRADWFVVDAARALEEQGDPRCMQTYLSGLRPQLDSAEVGERRKAVFKLGATRSASSVPLVLPSLRDSSAEIRIAALDALRTSGDAASIAAVEPLLNDPVGAVRDRATRTLETLRYRAEGEGETGRSGRESLRRLLRRPRR